MFKNILFDFDGTIMDTSPGIYESFDKVLEYFQIDFKRSEYKRMIGPPLKDSFKDILKIPESQIDEAIKIYREHYSTEGMYKGELYKGIIPLIKNLKNAGKKIFVATSKPELYTKKIIEKKGILDLFDFIGGSDLSEKSRSTKEDVVKYVLKNQKNTENLSESVLIGDRYFDIIGAHSVGIKCIGILWGFGNKKEFQKENADWIFETPEAVERFLLSKN